MVIFSSHHLEEVEKICETLTMIERGNVVISSSLNKLRHVSSQNLEGKVIFSGDFKSYDKNLDGEFVSPYLKGQEEISSFVSKICKEGGEILEVIRKRPSLESVYHNLRREN